MIAALYVFGVVLTMYFFERVAAIPVPRGVTIAASCAWPVFWGFEWVMRGLEEWKMNRGLDVIRPETMALAEKKPTRPWPGPPEPTEETKADGVYPIFAGMDPGRLTEVKDYEELLARARGGDALAQQVLSEHGIRP